LLKLLGLRKGRVCLGFGVRSRFCGGMNAIRFWGWLGGRSRLFLTAIALCVEMMEMMITFV
jgi:hypothetical protein